MRRTLIAPALLTAAAALLLAAGPEKPRYGGWGVDLADMDRSVNPGDDFYAYVEGHWLAAHPIAPDKVGAGYNYDLPDEIELQVKAIVEDAAAHPTSGQAREVGDFWAAWMDAGAIEAHGLAPAQPYLQRIAAVTTRAQLVPLMMAPGFATPVYLGIGADQDDPTRYAAAAA